jgi:endonuclease/exonuclease/phosphatase family metal-dependent hydrolase
MGKNEASGKKRLGLFNSLILVINLGFLIALGLSYLSVHTSPEKNWILPFFGLIYPFLLLINLFFIIYWMIRKRWIFLVPAIVILAGWGHITRTFQVRFAGNSSSAGHPLKVLTYNVKNLSNDNVDLLDHEIRDKIIGYLDSQNPDILCMQEFAVVHPDPEAFIDSLSIVLDMPYHAHSLYLARPRRLIDAIFIFSKFPVVNNGPINRDNVHNFGIQADLLIGNDTVRLLNVHLESIRLKHEDYSFISELDLKFEEDENLQEGSKRIFNKMRTAFANRAAQVDSLASFIKNSPYPVILCGDFNDTPNSYTYQQLTKDLRDAFMESGAGFGNTYIGNLPSFRIDFILYDDYFTSMNCRRDLVKLSDHYPLSCLVDLRQNNN